MSIIKSFLKKVLKRYYKYLVTKSVIQFGKNLSVNNYCKILSPVYLGNNVNFNGIEIFGKGKVFIGDNFHSGKNCQIISEIHNYKGGKIPYDDTFIVKDVVVEDNVWIGNNVIILSGVTIGEGAIIQAGSVVVSNIPKYAIAGGHPAKAFSQRDIQHYTELKQKNAFF